MNVFFGKYRAKVIDINDPLKQGRIRVACPRVYGSGKSPWCLPCLPYAFNDMGMVRMPNVDDCVWIEFEQGDIAFPIWVGGWWKVEATPVQDDYTEANLPKVLLLKDKAGNKVEFRTVTDQEKITIQDSKGQYILIDTKNNKIEIDDTNGNNIVLNANGITITDKNGTSPDFNIVRMKSEGIDIIDKNKNIVSMTSTGVKITATAASGAYLEFGSDVTLDCKTKNFKVKCGTMYVE